MQLKNRISRLEDLENRKPTNNSKGTIIVYDFIQYENNVKSVVYSIDNLGHDTLYTSLEALSNAKNIPLESIQLCNRGGILIPPEAKGKAINGVRVEE